VPGKAAWLELDDDPELEFEFRLAKDLGMTVRRLRTEMDNSEFIVWSRYYMRRDADKELAAQQAAQRAGG
jgi:hypothetical protein